jgi:NADH-quinone oxidoreductase subunit L
MLSITWLAIAAPLASAAILLIGGRWLDRWGHWLGVVASGATVVFGIGAFVGLLSRAAGDRAVETRLFEWIPGSTLHVDASLLLDPLSVSFLLLVGVVGTLIHVYSVAYMADDPRRRTFFAYLNLFVAAMLLLVLANSYLLLFVGWEGVGLASYLLIGFWNHKPEFASAANKAFVVNRVGDVGFIVALGLMFSRLGAVDFTGVFAAAPTASTGVLTAVGLMLLLAACGKSAQFPLQSWLGDAMAGPTPVSALIHAATMVTAGVYLVVRSAPIYAGAPTALLIVAIVGAITLLFGAIVGMAKDDIKKVLAASTISQIGYMMLAAGLGPVGYAFAIFHLITHGFFKAGLFLGAGSVMHGMDDQVDMRRFGGLSTLMRITWVTMGLGWLAILGVPPFSGFWSKDRIIEAAFIGEGIKPWLLGGVALVGAGLTAYYMSRLFFMTFHGQQRWTEGQHPHEAPALMTIPMVLLAVGSAAAGLALAAGNSFTTWLEPVTGARIEDSPVLPTPLIMTLTLTLVALGIGAAYVQYVSRPVPVTAPVASIATIAARKDLFQDVVNAAVFQYPGQYVTRMLVFVDATAVDGAVNGVGAGTARLGEFIRRFQSGRVRSYAAVMLIGVLIVAVLVVKGGA